MAGEINGTDAGLAVEATQGGGIFADIGGITTNSMTYNNGAIDITNKSAGGWRTLMDGAGLQAVDISAELTFSSDTNFGIMEGYSLNQTISAYQYARGGKTFTGDFKVTSWAETSPDNEKLTVSVSLQSSGSVVVS